MTSQDVIEKEFLRLIMMLYEIVPPVCKDYLQHNILTRAEYDGDLKIFLDGHLHDIYHLVHNGKCCQCGNSLASNANNNNNRKLYGKQFDKLYDETLFRRRGHVKWGESGKVTQKCICGYTVIQTCSLNDMDISTVNAIIQTCVHGIDSSHKMWLNKIVDIRNELCHIDDFKQLTKDYTDATWEYMKGSVLGLAESVPPKRSYMERVESGIKLLSWCEFQKDKVTIILDSMREECTVMKETMCKILRKLNDQAGANDDNAKKIIQKITDTHQKTEEKLNSICELIEKGFLHYHNKDVKVEVNLEQQNPVSGDAESGVCVTWKISKHPCTENEKADIIQNMRKVEQVIAVMLSGYKIEWIGTGSIVIATVLNKDVYSDKKKFEASIRQFLDRFLSISGIDRRSPCTLVVNISISKDFPKERVNQEETDRLLAKYFDKEQQVIPEMMDNSNETLFDLPFVLSIHFKRKDSKDQSPDETETEMKILLIADRSDFVILQDIQEVIEMLPANIYEMDIRSLIASKQTRVLAVYVVIANSHTRRTVANVIINLIQGSERIDLVPSDGMRFGYSTIRSIFMDEEKKWEEEFMFNVKSNLYQIEAMVHSTSEESDEQRRSVESGIYTEEGTDRVHDLFRRTTDKEYTSQFGRPHGYIE